MYTLLYFKWIISKDLLYSTGNSAQYYVPAWMERGFGGEWMHKCAWLSLFAVLAQNFAETTTTLLISYTPVQNVLGVKKIKIK